MAAKNRGKAFKVKLDNGIEATLIIRDRRKRKKKAKKRQKEHTQRSR